jgi:hypothetical protein
MKATLESTSVLYLLSGRDETGLIPEGAESALVEFKPSGEAERVFYCKSLKPDSSEEQIREHQRELDRLNKSDKTPEYLAQVAGLLKRLSSQ